MSWVDAFLAEESSDLLVVIPTSFLDSFMSRLEIEGWCKEIERVKSLFSGIERDSEGIEAIATKIYIMAHAAFLETDEGGDAVLEKVTGKKRCTCPRLRCREAMCFPCSSDLDQGVKMYCSSCQKMYNSDFSTNPDAFGTTYITRLVERHPEIVVTDDQQEYTPRIFGFRLVTKETEKQEES